jgi:hypothetical protein
VLAEGVAGVAAIPDHPERHAGEGGEEWHRVRQFVRLTRREGEGNGAPGAVGDHEGLGPEAATRAAKRLTLVPLLRRVTFLTAPAALACARIEVPSRNVM